MSENNGHSGAQWTKAVAAAAAAAAHSQHVPHLHLYDQQQQQHATGGVLAPPPSPLYGVGGVGGTIHHPHADNIGLVASYATARFQAPPIHNTSSHVAPATVLTPLVVGSSSTASNVPAPSGFVPPPFPPAATTPSGAATSGLNPNPFVVASGSNVGASGVVGVGGSSSGRFSLEQFQHLNPQQQFELCKLMNSAAAASLATNTSVTTGAGAGPMPLTTNTVTQPQPQILHPPGARHHGAPAAAASDLASSSGAITTTIAENVLSVISNSGTNSSGTATTPFPHGRLLGMGVKVPDDDKMRRIQHVVESGIGDHAKQQILQILDRISTLKPVEKLLLYLRLPGEAPETDPLRHPQNPLGTRSEINHTINWVRSHLEHDPQVSIPKQDVYNDYIAYCERLEIKPLSTADFGKVMKQVFPGIRPRRLGTRGHSRYCYAAMRKTTQLPAPQLPLLSSTQMASATTDGSEACSQPTGPGGPSINEADPATWDIIKTWAETLLNVKVENAKDLAERIKTNSALGASAAATHTRTNATQKKYAQREPKEKRSLADMGPLKKRRKKKRKGSSSSESSCNQQQKPALLLPQTNSNNSNNNNDLSPSTSGYAANSSLGVPSEDEQKSIKMIEVKQEFIESPNFQSVQQHMPNLPPMQAGTMGESYLHQHQSQSQHQQQQMMPMNLATEQRTVLTKAPPLSSAATGSSAFQRSSLSAVKNLTPKIMEISTTSPIHRSTNIAAVSPSGSGGAGSGAECQTSIKEEFIDEYNPTTILCKKVRKAQQTKGFWINSPTTPSTIPTITTTAASPPATTPTVIATAGTAATAVSPVSSSYHLMGPPAQITNNTSTSPSTSLQDGTSPKVASRNMQQLRAKKQQHSGGDNTPDIDKDADLPENLGLPRERVISICNMDKHELDHYFLPGQEENSEDQDTELLQYFQTGDAEEKLNSLDAAKHHRNPTASTATATQMPPTAIGNERQARLDGNIQSQQQQQQQQPLLRNDLPLKSNNNNNNKEIPANDRRTFANEVGRVLDGSSSSSFATAAAQLVATKGGGTSSPAVGVSASASLALMSQKHQQKQQQNQQQPPQSQKLNTNKRKINLHTTTSIPNYMTDMGSTRKNFIFFPISPNINSTTIATIGSGTTATSSSGSGPAGFFASPGLSARSRPKIALSKQQSLDNDSSDPMIGASRRRHSYVSAMSTSSTSASAPPSPSVLHQQQQQQQQQQMYSQQYGNYSTLQWIDPPISGGASGYNNMAAAANTAALLNEQNSLDLDIFGAAAAASSVNSNFVQNALDADEDDDCPLTPLTETQRSQSVPLSQLQRIHSPAFNRGGGGNNFQALNHHHHYSSSVRQTPVPPEFAGDSATLFSENSCSQHSGGGAGTGVGGCNNNPTSSVADAIKLEEAVVLASDSAALLDDVDVSEILSSPDFVAKFSSIAQASSAATTTCSSAGSSSGYSSGACTTFGSSMVGSMGMGGGIVSRSVPSTPLPHHQQNLFGNTHFYGRRRVGSGANDEIYLSPTAAGPAGTGSAGASSFTLATGGGRHNKYNSGSTHNSARSSYDISKSMPTTPITTPCFRYSPTEFNRDFLINGNTIDSINSSFGAVGSENLIGAGDSIGLVNLNSDSLIDDGAEGGSGVSVADAFVIGAGNDAESIIVGSDILGNL